MHIFKRYPWIKTVAGVAVFTLGFLALITPFTPGAIVLMLLGLELLGLRPAAVKKYHELVAAWKKHHSPK